MPKNVIFRLEKLDGTILANSQVITIEGRGSGPVEAADFVDNALCTIITTNNYAANLIKQIRTPPIYSLTANVTSVNEPGTIQWTFALVSGNIDFGATGRWYEARITSIVGDVNANDFVIASGDTEWSKDAVLVIGVPPLTLPFVWNTKITEDLLDEGIEQFRVDIYTWLDGITGNTSSISIADITIEINDTSKPIPTPSPPPPSASSPPPTPSPPPSASPPPPTPSPPPPSASPPPPSASPPPPTPSPPPPSASPPPTPTPPSSGGLTLVPSTAVSEGNTHQIVLTLPAGSVPNGTLVPVTITITPSP